MSTKPDVVNAHDSVITAGGVEKNTPPEPAGVLSEDLGMRRRGDPGNGIGVGIFYHFTHFTYTDYFERQASGGFPIVGVFDGRGKARDCKRVLKTSERGRANARADFRDGPPHGNVWVCGFPGLSFFLGLCSPSSRSSAPK